MNISNNEKKSVFKLILNLDKEEDQNIADIALKIQNKTGISSHPQFLRFCINTTGLFINKLSEIFATFDKILYFYKKCDEKLSLK